jgi:hypothetical protein
MCSLAACMLTSLAPRYFNDNLRRLDEFIQEYGEDGVKEINEIAHKHQLTMDVDVTDRWRYCGAQIIDGALAIVFHPNNLAVSWGHAFDSDRLLAALNAAPSAEGVKMSVYARTSLKKEWEPKVADFTKKVNEILHREDVTLDPNAEQLWEKFLEESKKPKPNMREDWESQFGYLAKEYFNGLISQLKSQGFADDDMLYEALNEAVPTGIFRLMVVDKTKRTYNDWIIEDGVFYIRFNTEWAGTSCGKACQDLTEGL